ncbi:type I restriction endonuclease subunit R [Helcococcus kunzii]|nr:type I restriction endonuclease subunit R [Helcococcus kunzii]
MDASLNEKLQNVEWGEYRIGDLFKIEKTSSFNSDKLVNGNEYDYITRTSYNQGILQTTGFINEENINLAGNWSLGLLQMDFFYRKKQWYSGQFVRKVIPLFNLKSNAIPFFTTVLNSLKPNLLNVLIRDVDDTFLNSEIKLPTKNNQIDFEFMESFVAELDAYLNVTGLKDYKLNDEEINAIDNLEKVKWHEFKMGDLFERIKTNKLPYKAKELPKEPKDNYILPLLTSSFMNQGLNYYAPETNATVLKNVISIPSNSDVYRSYYQSREFSVLSDAYAIEWKNKEIELSPNGYLFAVSCINKVTDLPIYSYKNKLGGWNVVKNKYVKLPVDSNGEIDFNYMENFTQGIKKLVIKDVVIYSDKKLEVTKDVLKYKK